MGINKREFHKYVNPGLPINRNSPLFCIEKVEYIVRTALKNIAGHRTLILYFYDKDKAADGNLQPLYTLFQCKDDYITFEQCEGEKSRWLCACLNNFGAGYFVKKCAFYSGKDEQRVLKYCNHAQLSGLSSLETLQASIMQERLTKRIKAREHETLERMKPIPPLPRDLKGWVHREVLPAYIFYEYHRSRKPMTGYCTSCRHDVLVSGARHNNQGNCPRCKKPVTFKATGIAKCVWDRATCQVLQRTGPNELVLRIIKVSKSYRDFRQPDFHVWENSRAFVGWDELKHLKFDSYYYSYSKGVLTNWQKGKRPHFLNYQYNFECDICGKLYCRNLAETISGTPWQYCQLEAFYKKDNEPMEVIPYMFAYSKYPVIEYLVKLGLTQLTSDIVYRNYLNEKVIQINGKNIKEVLGIQAEDIVHLQDINANLSQLSRLQEFRSHKGRFEKELYEWCLDHDLSYGDIKRPLLYTTGRKLLRYIKEQFKKNCQETNPHSKHTYSRISYVLHDYNDYLRFGEELSYNLADSFVLFPRHLKEAHDRAYDLIEMRRRLAREQEEQKRKKEATEKINALYQSLLRKFQFTKDDLTVVPPKSAEDIVFEGHALHHCIGSWYSSHADGKCIILFIRKKDTLDQPFCTMEVRNGKVAQVRGYNNEDPEPEVKDFVSLWEQEKLNQDSDRKAA